MAWLFVSGLEDSTLASTLPGPQSRKRQQGDKECSRF